MLTFTSLILISCEHVYEMGMLIDLHDDAGYLHCYIVSQASGGEYISHR